MNRTKRKIFETSMRLFSEKGYDATSIEEITAVVGVAKGTLYYHFSSKEEIFNFLVEEGMKLLKNSIEIKVQKCETTVEKLKAVSLVQLKAIIKYENLLTIVVTQTLGNEKRHEFCREKVAEYIDVIEEIINEGQKKGDIIDVNSKILATQIFSLTCSTLIYKRNENMDVLDREKIYGEYEKTLFANLEK